MPPDPPRMVAPPARQVVPSALHVRHNFVSKSSPPQTKFAAAASGATNYSDYYKAVLSVNSAQRDFSNHTKFAGPELKV